MGKINVKIVNYLTLKNIYLSEEEKQRIIKKSN
jgi:hypothetical protein